MKEKEMTIQKERERQKEAAIQNYWKKKREAIQKELSRRKEEWERQKVDSDILVYKIVERTDLSMKALTKKLSSYSSLELSQLPINKRLRYKILVKPGLLKEEIGRAHV